MDPTGQKSIDKIKVTVDGGLLRETLEAGKEGHIARERIFG